MRLIDADALIEFIDVGHLRHPSEICFSELDVVNMLNHAPTAYDVEKVVAELKNESDYEPIDYDWGDISCSGEEYFIATGTAIDIVKRGGITHE